MKKRVSYGLAGLLVLALMYVLLTPMGALRGTVLLSGHPVEAVTLKVRPAAAEDVGLNALDAPEGTTMYRITEHIPHANETDTDLLNWSVTRHGIFYTAGYYGYC